MCFSLAKYQPTNFNVVPPLVMMMALNPNITKEHLAKTKVISSGGSPLSPQIIEKLKEKVHPDCELKVEESNDCSRL